MQINGWTFSYFQKENNSREMVSAYDYFLYINGRFPAEENLINVSGGEIPNFTKTHQVISPPTLY